MPSDFFQGDTDRSDCGGLAGCLDGGLDELAQGFGPLPGLLLVVALACVVIPGVAWFGRRRCVAVVVGLLQHRGVARRHGIVAGAGMLGWW